jgi:hypothetical protein
MTEPRDWLDDALDRHPGEPVPEDFSIRLMSRIRSESRTRLFRSPWAGRGLIAAGALVFLGLGYWMGMGAPSLTFPDRLDRPGDLAAADLEELWQNRDLLESWDLLQDPELELGFGESASGGWAFGLDAPETQPR